MTDRTGHSIGEALSIFATRQAGIYSRDTEPPLTDPPSALGWSRSDWDSLSPGCKREIERDLARRGLIDTVRSPEHRPETLAEKRARVEYEGRKRL